VIKWAEISEATNQDRFDEICRALDSYGVEHEGQLLTPERGEEFERVLKEAKESCTSIHFRHPFIHVSSIENLPVTDLVSWISARDALQKIHNHWWPYNHLFHSIPKFFSLNQMAVDFKGGGLVLGSGGAGCTAMASLAHMGLKKITVMDTDDGRATQSAQVLKKHFWGATIESQSHHALTYLPGSYSVVINALPPEKEARLKAEISYFNFLYPSGIYVDLKGISDPALMEEASRVGARLVYGTQITSMADAHWMKESFKIDAPLKEIALKLPQRRVESLHHQP
jgi:hypothetical protein